MPKSFRGLYAVLLVFVLSAPTASASAVDRPATEPRSWPFAGTLSNLFARIFDHSGGGPDADPAGVGSGETAPAPGEATDPVEEEGGPHADPAG